MNEKRLGSQSEWHNSNFLGEEAEAAEPSISNEELKKILEAQMESIDDYIDHHYRSSFLDACRALKINPTILNKLEELNKVDKVYNTNKTAEIDEPNKLDGIEEDDENGYSDQGDYYDHDDNSEITKEELLASVNEIQPTEKKDTEVESPIDNSTYQRDLIKDKIIRYIDGVFDMRTNPSQTWDEVCIQEGYDPKDFKN